jgi:hypothetical protein
MWHPLDPIFRAIDRAFSDGDRTRFETPVSRWIASFSQRYRVWGVLLRSGLGASFVTLIFLLMTGNKRPYSTLGFLLVSAIFLAIWFAMWDSWQRRTSNEELE